MNSTHQYASLQERLLDPAWIRAEQRRIIELLHVVQCPLGSASVGSNGEVCSSLPRCEEFKALKGHMDACNDKGCGYNRCKSSKYHLNHFNSCTDTACAHCQPIREKCFKRVDREGEEHRSCASGEETAMGSSERKRKQPWERLCDDGHVLELFVASKRLATEQVCRAGKEVCSWEAFLDVFNAEEWNDGGEASIMQNSSPANKEGDAAKEAGAGREVEQHRRAADELSFAAEVGEVLVDASQQIEAIDAGANMEQDLNKDGTAAKEAGLGQDCADEGSRKANEEEVACLTCCGTPCTWKQHGLSVVNLMTHAFDHDTLLLDGKVRDPASKVVIEGTAVRRVAYKCFQYERYGCIIYSE